MSYRLNIKIIMAVVFIMLLIPVPLLAADGHFSDVPQGHFAEKAINDFRAKNITQGIGNNKFGFGNPIKRDEFVTFLVKLVGWETVNPSMGSFSDNLNTNQWYYKYIETALQHGVIPKDGAKFRPEEYITRQEMAVMIVRSLGYDALAGKLAYLGKPFEDVSDNSGYITIVKDMEIVNGRNNSLFAPGDLAKKEEAAVIMMRMYEKINHPIDTIHAFYAIDSYRQISMLPALNSVSFGWSALQYDNASKQVILNMTSDNNNSFALPNGFSEPVKLAQKSNIPAQLSVFASQDSTVRDEQKQSGTGLVEYIITNPDIRKKVIENIVQKLNSTVNGNEEVSFDGVVIDFEDLRGANLRPYFNTFLEELKGELKKYSKSLYVAVQPARKPGEAYFDGYDFKAIGGIADKVILMAHDYNASSLTPEEMRNGYTDTPLTPIDEIYYALKAATDKQTGISDLSKLWLQISFGSAQWQSKDGKVINQNAYHPTYDKIVKRLQNNDKMQNLTLKYSESLENPWITYNNNNDDTDNIIWYEDSRSVIAKINLAKMFGINGISLWRLGEIPDYGETGNANMYLDVWNHIKNQAGKN